MSHSPSIRRRLALLRAQMQRHGLAAYYIPSNDPHASEYVPPCWQRQQWISGFDGSAGDMIVTTSTAGLWTDGRYYIQASRQLAGTTIRLFKQGQPGVPSPSRWIASHLRPGDRLEIDARVVTRQHYQRLDRATRKAEASLRLMARNLVDEVWQDRPAPPAASLGVHPICYAGESPTHKLRRLRRAMTSKQADVHLVSALDEIAWLFNIRGADIPYNPVAIAHAVVTGDRAFLFCDGDKLAPDVLQHLGRRIEALPYDEFGPFLRAINSRGLRIWVDPDTVNMWSLRRLNRCKLILETSALQAMKARKNTHEIRGMRAAHLRDGVAMVRFLYWLEQSLTKGRITERTAAAKLRGLRSEVAGFRGESFAPIVGFGANGAIVHYCATAETEREIKPHGLLLVDSGGHYEDGTTDITRTILVGSNATAEQRDRFTRVLKGHIGLACCRFPLGTTGIQLDALARASLWSSGLDYAHGTGHGVGAYLSVHERPPSLSPKRGSMTVLEKGHVVSNEPGYYREGAYGIRIENLLLVDEDTSRGSESRTFLRFEVLTLCPIDTRLVAPALLDPRERRWLNAYHRWVRKELSPLLAPRERRWLRQATTPI